MQFSHHQSKSELLFARKTRCPLHGLNLSKNACISKKISINLNLTISLIINIFDFTVDVNTFLSLREFFIL